MRTDKGVNDSQIFIFDSMAEVVDYIDDKYYSDRGASFVGERLPTWESVTKRNVRPWAEGMYILDEYIKKLRNVKLPELKSHKRRTEFNETEGDEVDYDRLQSGQPFWRSAKREESTGPTEVTILTDVSTPGRVASENILWRGAVALALAQILEEKGFKVELWVIDGGNLFNNSSRPVYIAANLKRASDPLDTSTLINTVAGWFYRTVTFTLFETLADRTGNECTVGYGRPIVPKAVDLDKITPDELRIFSSGAFSFDGALSIVRSELERLRDRIPS